VEIVVAVDRHDPTLEGALTPGHVALFCTPAINLFPKKTDRIRLDDRENEFHVVADRTRPLDFEVHSIVGVSGYGMKGDMRREFRPLYQSRGVIDPANDGAFYTVTRRARLAAAVPNPKLPRSNYLGGEVFLSLVDGDEGPYRSDLRQLGIQALCTNRDLPLRMPVAEDATDFYVESGAPVEAVRCVAGPSAPRPTDPSGETAWRLISHLSLNYLSLSGSEAGGGAAALRELLQLYGNLLDPSVVRQIDGVRAVGTRPVVRRLPFTGPVTFARGIELTVECDEAAFEGRSLALFGVVLEQFFARYVSINSFTQTVLRSPQRGEVARWAPRIGRRPTL